MAGVPLEHTFKLISEKPDKLLPEISIPLSFSDMVIPRPANGFVHSILLMMLLKNPSASLEVPLNSVKLGSLIAMSQKRLGQFAEPHGMYLLQQGIILFFHMILIKHNNHYMRQ